jgi:hypothetical protein
MAERSDVQGAVELLSPIHDGVLGVWGATPIMRLAEFNVSRTR